MSEPISHRGAVADNEGSEMSHGEAIRATELRLMLEGDRVARAKPLRFVLTLHNGSAVPITLHGLLPYRASANPPMLEVTAADGRYFRTRCGTAPSLQTEAPIQLPAGGSVVLMSGDLTNCSGHGRDADSRELRLMPASESFFAAGDYEARATFQPTALEPGEFRQYAFASEVVAFQVVAD